MFDRQIAENAVEYIVSSIRHYPVGYVHGYVSTLGGFPSILLTISLDEKERWPYNILENSRYAKFIISHTGVIEIISFYRVAKFRKTRVSSVGQIVDKLGKWVEKSLLEQ